MDSPAAGSPDRPVADTPVPHTAARVHSAAGNSADIVNFFQAGEMKSLAVTNDAYLNASFDASDLTAGDIFQYTTNAAGEINNMVSIYNLSADLASGALASGNNIGTISYDVAAVVGITSKSLDLANGASYGWDLGENATNVLFDVAKASANINNAFSAKTGTSYIREAKVDNNNTPNDATDDKYTSDVYVTVVKADDGVAIEVVTYKYTKVDGGVNKATFDARFGGILA